MKLALTIPHFSPATGGAEGFAVSVVRELARRGHELLVVAEDGNPMDGVKTVFGDLNSIGREGDAFGAELHIDWGLNVPAHIHRLGGGTHRQFLGHALQAYPGPWRVLKKLSYALSAKHRRTAQSERELITRPGARFVAVSEFVAEQLREAAAPSQPTIKVLHNGVDADRFAPERLKPLRGPCRRKLGLKDDDIAFLFVAHNLRLKNIALIKTVFRKLHKELPQAKLILLGKRDPNIRAPWFVYAGSTSSPEEYYAAADALLHPTYYDACANVVLEALASGLPVVSSDRNGSAEIMERGKQGYILPVTGDRRHAQTQWEEAVKKLTTDPSLLRNMSVAARQLALAHTLQAYVDHFEEILVAHAGPACDNAQFSTRPR